jgi:phosphate starvation-inducible PhoH-like protein
MRRAPRRDRDNREDDDRGGWRQQQPQKRPNDIVVTAKTPGQKRYIVEIKNNDITFCVGPAGSGKTAIAIGLALQDVLSKNPTYKKIVVMRPVKEACDEHVGYLPGDLMEKMIPWAAPVVDNMSVFIDPRGIKGLFMNGIVEVVPLAYARGRSLNDSFIILDEAQNVAPKQMLMVLTRVGSNSKLVINGDVSQTDTVGQNGLVDAFGRLDGIRGISFVQLEEEDIVRNGLICEIIKRYSDSVPSSRIFRPEGE